MAHTYFKLLLNDGTSNVLLNDGTSDVLLNSHTGGGGGGGTGVSNRTLDMNGRNLDRSI